MNNQRRAFRPRTGWRHVLVPMTMYASPQGVVAALALLTGQARAETIAGRATVIGGDTLEIHGERIRIIGH